MDAGLKQNIHPMPIAANRALNAAHTGARMAGRSQARGGGDGSAFASKLAAAHSVGNLGPGRRNPAARAAGEDQHGQLKHQAEKWVAQTFYGNALKQMHNSPFKSKIFDGGRGGEAFGSMFDQTLADRMSRGAGGKLTDSIVRKIEGRQAYQTALAAQKEQAAAFQARMAKAQSGQSAGQPNTGAPSHAAALSRSSLLSHIGRNPAKQTATPAPAQSSRAPFSLFDPSKQNVRKHVSAGHGI